MIQFIVLVRILYLWGDTVLSRYIKDMYAPRKRGKIVSVDASELRLECCRLHHVDLTVLEINCV